MPKTGRIIGVQGSHPPQLQDPLPQQQLHQNIDTRKFPANHYRVRVTDKASFQLNLKLYLVINLISWGGVAFPWGGGRQRRRVQEGYHREGYHRRGPQHWYHAPVHCLQLGQFTAMKSQLVVFNTPSLAENNKHTSSLVQRDRTKQSVTREIMQINYCSNNVHSCDMCHLTFNPNFIVIVFGELQGMHAFF